MAIFYFLNLIFAAETIQGWKLFKGGNYSWKYGMLFLLMALLKKGLRNPGIWGSEKGIKETNGKYITATHYYTCILAPLESNS